MTAQAEYPSVGVTGALAEIGRASIHGLGWSVLVATLAPTGSVLAAFVGGFAGCLIGAKLGRTRLRTSAVVIGAISLIALVAWFRASLTHNSVLAAALGPVGALRFAGTLTALLLATIGSAAMRAGSTRRAALAVFELLLIAVAFAQLFIPHRHGAINRPFYLADWIIALGWDPTWLFLFMGGTATVFGLVLLLREQRFGRAVLNLGVIALLLAVIVVATPMLGMPPPPDGGLAFGPTAPKARKAGARSKNVAGPLRVSSSSGTSTTLEGPAFLSRSCSFTTTTRLRAASTTFVKVRSANTTVESSWSRDVRTSTTTSSRISRRG